MVPPDPRAGPACELELVEVAASAVARLVVAHVRGDVPAIIRELERLLKGVATYSRALGERPDDEALRRAVALMSTSR